MADRFALIARKQEVRRRLETLQRQLEHERTKSPPAPRRIQQLEQQVDQLMAEEYQLRVAIDQAGR
jgi:chromosome segregation ATPase